MIQSRKRLGVAAGTAAMTLAGVFAFPSAANAETAVAPNPVTKPKIVGGENKVTVSWSRPVSGTQASSYIVYLFNEKGEQVGGIWQVDEPATSVTIDTIKPTDKKLPAGFYFAHIYSRNAWGTAGPAVTDLAEVTDAATPPPPEVNRLPYRPYANWNDLIDQEYRMWTGCSANTKEVTGRFPRDDEFTYWLDWLTDELPLDDYWTWGDDSGVSVLQTGPYAVTNNWTRVDVQRFDERARFWSDKEWDRLSNGVIDTNYFFDGIIDFIDAPELDDFKASTIYKSLYSEKYSELTSIPVTGGLAPADDPLVNPGGNGNNLIELGESIWAATLSDSWARWEPNISTAFSQEVADTVGEWAYNDVYFGRRVDFVRQLAENAEQVEGPAYRLYTAYFARTPDAGGLCFWGDKLQNGWSLLDVSEFFVTSPEFLKTYGEYETYGVEEKTDAAEFVSLVYRNVLDREPDAMGESFWVRQLQTERYSPAEMLIGFSESQEFKNRMASNVGTGLMYLHELGRMPKPHEYVEGDIYYDYFQTNPDEPDSSLTDSSWMDMPWWPSINTWGWSAPNSALYWWIVDTGGEYLARTQIAIPQHLHPHEAPGSLNHEAN